MEKHSSALVSHHTSHNNLKDAEVEITFDPPWSQDLMSEEAKLELGLL